MKMRRLIPSILLGLAVTTAAVPVFADTDGKAIEQLIATFADKPEEHVALAKYYREQAAEARNQVAHHRQMRQGYQRGGPKVESMFAGMRSHCDNLIKTYDSAAKEYEQMAAEHEKMAKPGR